VINARRQRQDEPPLLHFRSPQKSLKQVEKSCSLL